MADLLKDAEDALDVLIADPMRWYGQRGHQMHQHISTYMLVLQMAPENSDVYEKALRVQDMHGRMM